MTTIDFVHGEIDGSARIRLPDGGTGSIWLNLHPDLERESGGSFISGRPDVIAAAAQQGKAEVRLPNGTNFAVEISNPNGHYAKIKLIPEPQNVLRLISDEPFVDRIRTTVPSFLSFIGGGKLVVPGEMSGYVSVQAHPIDGCIPHQLEVNGEADLIEAAYHHAKVDLELFNVTFRTTVCGQLKDTGVLLVLAEPMFRSLARHLKRRSH